MSSKTPKTIYNQNNSKTTMNTKTIITIISLIVLTSCTLTGREAPATNYRTGSTALQMMFVPGNPPEQIFDNEANLMISLELTNTGAETLGSPGDRIYLSGFDPKIVTGIPSTGNPIPSLQGKGLYRPEIGDMGYVTFNSGLTPLKTDKFPFTLLATACYRYKTIATAMVCIDPDPFSVGTRDKACTPQDLALGTQGAPIAVSTVEVEPAKGKTRFVITIANVGNGEVFKEDATSMAKCSPHSTEGLKYDTIDYIRVTSVQVSDQTISCQPLTDGSYLRLNNGQAKLYCEYAPRSSSTFTTPLIIQLDYGYKNTITKQMEIINEKQEI